MPEKQDPFNLENVPDDFWRGLVPEAERTPEAPAGLLKHIDWMEAPDEDVPSHLIGGLRDYKASRTPTGDFLRACLENDFYTVAIKADPFSLKGLRAVALWIKEELPPEAWGSSEKVEAWLAGGDE